MVYLFTLYVQLVDAVTSTRVQIEIGSCLRPILLSIFNEVLNILFALDLELAWTKLLCLLTRVIYGID